MTMREEVVKAVEAVERSLEANYGKGAPVHGHMALLDKALRDQEAEIARLQNVADGNAELYQHELLRSEKAEANLEASNRAVETYREILASIIRVVRERDDRELQAHIDATGIATHLTKDTP